MSLKFPTVSEPNWMPWHPTPWLRPGECAAAHCDIARGEHPAEAVVALERERVVAAPAHSAVHNLNVPAAHKVDAVARSQHRHVGDAHVLNVRQQHSKPAAVAKGEALNGEP